MIDSLKGKRIHLICLYINLAVICRLKKVCNKRDSADDLGVANYTNYPIVHMLNTFSRIFFSQSKFMHISQSS